jgi:chemotaxis protein methyltransferase CheR
VVLDLSQDAFTRLSRMVYERFRILLTERKRSLIVSRLSRFVQTQGFERFEDYLDAVEDDRSGQAVSELVNRLSTNFTFFNREPAHFEFFQRQFLAQRDQATRGDQRLHVWVPGCASGEEPWMLAICLSEHYGQAVAQKAAILATDISARALSTALEGIYSAENTSRLPAGLRAKYFDEVSAESWRVKDKLRSLVLFRRLNLNRPAFPFRRGMDAIFCRNVMIYFDVETKEDLARRFHENLLPGGCLFIGHSESIDGGGRFTRILPAVYRRKEGA